MLALRDANDVLMISPSPDGRTAVTASDNGKAGVWAMPVPVQDDPEQVLRWAQRITGLRLDEDGAFHVLSPEEVARLSFPALQREHTWHRSSALEHLLGRAHRQSAHRPLVCRSGSGAAAQGSVGEASQRACEGSFRAANAQHLSF
jgi:hypothetical protein